MSGNWYTYMVSIFSITMEHRQARTPLQVHAQELDRMNTSGNHGNLEFNETTIWPRLDMYPYLDMRILLDTVASGYFILYSTKNGKYNPIITCKKY